MKNMYIEADYKRLLQGDDGNIEPSNNTYRDRFHEDVSRLVHSPSFRRMDRKRQLLPSEHSDFVRNRLTHSAEVAQVATSIGAKLNSTLGNSDGLRLKADVLLFAGLAHDIGHPPFGHLGERILNQRMWDAGGFEGNAQTFRILSRLENRLTRDKSQSYINGDILRHGPFGHGLNPTMRSLASIFKYDKCLSIEDPRPNAKKGAADFDKGYYQDDSAFVEAMKGAIKRDSKIKDGGFKTIEAKVMDIADDIAYSIYDLEDCLKTGVLTPDRFFTASLETLTDIGHDMAKSITKYQLGPHIDPSSKEFLKKLEENRGMLTPQFLNGVVLDIFSETNVVGDVSSDVFERKLYEIYSHFAVRSNALATDDKFRRMFTETYISKCIRACRYSNSRGDDPQFWNLQIDRRNLMKIEFLKKFNFRMVIQSERIQSADRRCENIIKVVFDALYLPGDEFEEDFEDFTGFGILPSELRDEVKEIYSNCNADLRSILEISERATSASNSSLRSERFVIRSLLKVRDYRSRADLSNAIYAAMKMAQMEQSNDYRKIEEKRIALKRLVCDFIARLTDRAVVDLYERLESEDGRQIRDRLEL